ncbi:MAG: PTS glucose transporter subunit IIA [Lachnospiraceae bacterium]|nr:PTS glucose transporter subunit IIA [uncultured Acetatifactor sp.]MCI9231950.1 PTS glucose transporter subunit IIA [Lachnospiraceae bacterium]
MLMLGVMWMMTAVVVGFMLGRVSMYGQVGALEEVSERTEGERSTEERHSPIEERHSVEERHSRVEAYSRERPAAREGRHFLRRGKGNHEEERESWSVGSPVSGYVAEQSDGEQPTVVVDPDSGQVFAPAGGKITRLFPLGNAFRLLTEFGTQLYVQVGDVGDELLGRYYRPRVVQNEIVGKGKLLLEFDREGLAAEGVSCDVRVCVEGFRYGHSVKDTAGERVRIGEEIFRVQGEVRQEAPLRYRAFD